MPERFDTELNQPFWEDLVNRREVDTGWLEPASIDNGWAVVTDERLVYRKIGTLVCISGRISAAAASSGVVFTLPDGFRPGTRVKVLIVNG